MKEIDLNDTYWERVEGIVSELKVDSRWILKHNGDDKPYGSLRIVSHPDLPPGHLRSYFTYVKNIEPKDDIHIMKTLEDYQVDKSEIELYSIGDEIETETATHVDTFKELEKMFGVKIFK